MGCRKVVWRDKCGDLDDETLAELEHGVRGGYMSKNDGKASCPECLVEKKEHYCSKHQNLGSEYYFNKLSETPKFVWIILFLVVFSIVCAPSIAIMLNGLTSVLSEKDLKALAAYGDSFGGLNALFSGLAFAGLIWTILLQRKELSLQRLELSETRKELKKSAAAQEEASKHQEKLAILQAYSTKLTNVLDEIKGLKNEYNQIETVFTKTCIKVVRQNNFQPYTQPDADKIKDELRADSRANLILDMEKIAQSEKRTLLENIDSILSSIRNTP